jgi:hypothetical protein
MHFSYTLHTPGVFILFVSVIGVAKPQDELRIVKATVGALTEGPYDSASMCLETIPVKLLVPSQKPI